jgi:hypothetical protein
MRPIEIRHWSLGLLGVLAACAAPGKGDTSGRDDTSGDPRDSDTASHDTGEPPVDVDQRADNLATGPGDYALDFLAAGYTSLVIEVDWVTGHAPDGAALDTLVTTLEEVCNKPDGVTIVLDDEIPDQGAPAWSYAAAEDTEVAWRDRYRDPETGEAVLYYLYLDGNSDQDSDQGLILGYAYHGSSLIMFQQTMADAGGGILGLGDVEPTVLVHEAGHVLGLVDDGIPMVTNHEDPAHPHHDANDGCVMYWAAETDAVADLLGTGALTFDEPCRADMRAAGGR